jgi:hypothetical protein
VTRNRSGSIVPVQRFCEVAGCWQLIVTAFVVVELCVDAGYDAFIATVGRTLRLQMQGTTGFIFVAFYFRSCS